MSISKSPKSQYGQRAVKWLTSYMKSISKYETDPARVERLARSHSLFTGVPASNIFDFREGQQWFDGDDEPGPTMIALVWNHSGNVIDTEYVMDDSRAAIRYAESVLADRNREVARFALRQVMREPVSFGGSEEQAWNGRHLRAAHRAKSTRPNPCGCSARANPRKSKRRTTRR